MRQPVKEARGDSSNLGSQLGGKILICTKCFEFFTRASR
jgi:hypothetical protein